MKRGYTPARHCGLDPQSRGARPGIQQDKTTAKIPLSLDGRGIKGEGDNDASPPSPSYWL